MFDILHMLNIYICIYIYIPRQQHQQPLCTTNIAQPASHNHKQTFCSICRFTTLSLEPAILTPHIEH